MNRLPYIPVTVEQPTWVDPATTLDIVVPIDLSVVFRAWGPFPAVIGVENQTGPWTVPGNARNPLLSDGSTATEKLTEYVEGHSFAYELTEFTGTLRHVITKVRGEWTMTPDGTGAVVRWTYSFYPRRGRRWLVQTVLRRLWHAYASRALAATLDFVEAQRPVHGRSSQPQTSC